MPLALLVTLQLYVEPAASVNRCIGQADVFHLFEIEESFAVGQGVQRLHAH